MSWNKTTTKTTPHTCSMAFGKKTPGCPRCDELLAGAEPVKWAWAEHKKKMDEIASKYPERKHVCDSRCGSVCTHGDW